jgi:hypothetical protein
MMHECEEERIPVDVDGEAEAEVDSEGRLLYPRSRGYMNWHMQRTGYTRG